MTTVEPINPEQADAVLGLPMPEGNYANADTVRGYLAALFAAMWVEGEGPQDEPPTEFNGWDRDLMIPLVSSGMIDIADVEADEAGTRLITAAILRMATTL